MELWIMAMKGYSTFPRPPEVESHLQTQLSVLPEIHLFYGIYSSAGGYGLHILGFADNAVEDM